jgi:hypothetical protein
MKNIPRLLAVHLVLPGLLVAPLANGSDHPLDEVLVEVPRGKLLQEMVKLEDRFFDRYNELNPNDDFDTHCQTEARVGTRLERRYCRAVYVEKALMTEGHDHLEARKKMMDPANATLAEQPWAPPVPPTLEIVARHKDYQQNMRDVVRRHPELVELLRARYDLGMRYEATRGKASGKPSPQENEATSAAPLLP